jgi:hypothetical protein
MNVDVAELPEIELERGQPTWSRLIWICFGIIYLVWESAGLIEKGYPPATGDSTQFLIVLFVCGGLILYNIFQSNLRWTIRSHEIQIDENWIYDRREVKRIGPGEITKITIASEPDEGSEIFYIRIWLGSGHDVQSPPLRDGQRARAVKAEIEKRLGMSREHAMFADIE